MNTAFFFFNFRLKPISRSPLWLRSNIVAFHPGGPSVILDIILIYALFLIFKLITSIILISFILYIYIYEYITSNQLRSPQKFSLQQCGLKHAQHLVGGTLTLKLTVSNDIIDLRARGRNLIYDCTPGMHSNNPNFKHKSFIILNKEKNTYCLTNQCNPQECAVQL